MTATRRTLCLQADGGKKELERHRESVIIHESALLNAGLAMMRGPESGKRMR